MLNVAVDLDLFSLGEPGGPVSLQAPVTKKGKVVPAAAPKASAPPRRKAAAPAKKAPVAPVLRQDGPSGPLGSAFDGPSGPMGSAFDGPSGPMGSAFDGPSGPMLF